MLAQIIVSQNLEERQNYFLQKLSELGYKNPDPDLLYIPVGEKLGVEAAKKIREFLSIRPYQKEGKVVIIESAEGMTSDAQNSLLKTLEEPPATAILMLGVSKEDSLLPTILSRCIIVPLQTTVILSEAKDISLGKNEIEGLLNQTIEERIAYIEKVEDKEQLLEDLIHYFRDKLKTDPQILPIMKELMRAQEYKSAKGNIRTILEYLMLKLPSK